MSQLPKEDSIKICFISPHAYPLFNPHIQATIGGAEVQLYLLSNELAKDDRYTVHFITADYGQKSREIFDAVTVHKSFFLDLHREAPLFMRICRQIFGGMRLIYVLVKINADIYIQRNAGAETGITAFMCALRRKKFIYMTASDIDCDGSYVCNNGLRGKLFLYGINHAHTIITQREQHKMLLMKHLELESIKLNTAYPLASTPTSQREYILWVGRINELKQPELMLKIANNFNTIRFIMIGPQSCSIDAYNAFLSKLANHKNITYLPRVPFEEISNYFAQAILFINTSSKEGFPNTFVQAWLHGVPVLTLGVDPDGIMANYKIGCASESLEKLCATIETFLNNTKLYQEYSQNAFVYVNIHHNLKIIIEEFKKILEKDTKKKYEG